MARAPKPAPEQPKEYFVLDPAATSIGDMPFGEKDGQRTVTMTPGQAQFFIDQGAIGESANLKAKAAGVQAQMIGSAEAPQMEARKAETDKARAAEFGHDQPAARQAEGGQTDKAAKK